MTLHTTPAGGVTPIPEGSVFGSDGSLYFVSVFGDDRAQVVFRADLEARRVHPIFGSSAYSCASMAIAPDGTIYVADLGLVDSRGRIIVLAPDGGQERTLVDEYEGGPIYPDDLIFDSRGNLWFNDMTGNVLKPDGRIFRRTPTGDLSVVVQGLAAPNGLALDPTESRLWVSEHTANRLLTIRLDEHGDVNHGALPGSAIVVAAHLSGGVVDSLTVDSEGNVYAAIFGAGRVDVFDGLGHYLATVKPQDSDHNYPNSTHVAIRPGTREGYLVAGGPSGAELFSFPALAEGLPLKTF
jgi:lactonase